MQGAAGGIGACAGGIGAEGKRQSAGGDDDVQWGVLVKGSSSFTLYFTILVTRFNGMGLSIGNLIAPLDDSYAESCFLNARIGDAVG